MKHWIKYLTIFGIVQAVAAGAVQAQTNLNLSLGGRNN